MTKLHTCRRGATTAGAAMLVISVLAGNAAALTASQQNAMRAQCRDDFISHCSDVSPGGQAALACLQKNVSTLSTGCKQVVQGTLPHSSTAKRATASPVAAPPAAAPPAAAPPAAAPPAAAPPATTERMPDNQTLFAPGAALIAKACTRTLLLHCRGQIGEGRGISCLKSLRDRGHFLGPRCSEVLKLQSEL